MICGIKYSVILLALMNFLILAYQSTKAFDIQPKDSISRSLMKILINHNNYLNYLLPFQNIIFSSGIDTAISLSSQISTVGTITDATIFDCLIQQFVGSDNVPIARTVFFSFVPLIILLCLIMIRFFVVFVAGLIPKLRNKVAEKNLLSIFISCFVLVVYSFYPKLVLNTFSLLKCISLDESGRSFLEIDPNIQCWEKQHMYYILTVFLPNLLLWCLGWPFIYGLALFLRKRRVEKSLRKKKSLSRIETFGDQFKNFYTESSATFMKKRRKTVDMSVIISDLEKDEIFQSSKIFRFLTLEYHSNCYAWDLFFFLTNLILTPLSLQSSFMDPVTFSVLLMLIFFFMLVLSITLYPFRFHEINNVCFISYIGIMMTFYCITNMLVVGASDAQIVFYLGLMFVINGGFYLCWIVGFLIVTLTKMKEKIKEKLKKKNKKDETLVEMNTKVEEIKEVNDYEANKGVKEADKKENEEVEKEKDLGEEDGEKENDDNFQVRKVELEKTIHTMKALEVKENNK